MKFSEMPYNRIDCADVCAEYDRLTAAIKNAESADEVFAAVDKHEDIWREFSTMSSLAYARHTIDTKDEFYAAEKDFYDEAEPTYIEASQKFLHALVDCKYRAEIGAKYGTLLLRNMEIEMKTFKPEIMDLLSEENRLMSEYQRLIASAEINFDGKLLNISQLGAYKVNRKREVRRSAYTAEGNFYMSIADKLDDIYDRLVKIRTEAGRKLGYENFVGLAYMRRMRNCYGRADIEKFRESVVEKIVPLINRLKAAQAARLEINFADMLICDSAIEYKEGNPKPQGTADDILKAGGEMYTRLSRETAEFIKFMYDNELLDVKAKPGKAVGGYCTDFPLWNSPFIFSNFNGTTGDVDVLTHEAGHAFAAYMSPRDILLELQNPTIEACEVHSMSMEFFAWKYHELFYGADAARSKFLHLSDAVNFLPYGCLVDHFQHLVYERPDMSSQERNRAWLELEKLYRPYMKFGDIPFYSDGRGWQRQPHIYLDPFYYIDYCFAQTVALEFWQLSQNDYAAAWEKYLKFVRAAGTKTFTELCDYANIKSPFDAGALEEISAAVEKALL